MYKYIPERYQFNTVIPLHTGIPPTPGRISLMPSHIIALFTAVCRGLNIQCSCDTGVGWVEGSCFSLQSHYFSQQLYLYHQFHSWISPMPSHMIALLAILCGGYSIRLSRGSAL